MGGVKIPRKMKVTKRVGTPVRLSTATNQTRFSPRLAALYQNHRNPETDDEELTDGDWISTNSDWADGDWLENNA